jgi:hypothetical protein
VPHRENAAVNAVKAGGVHSSQATALSYTRTLKLLHRDHAVLLSRKSSDGRIRIAIGALPTHVGG